MSAIEWSVSHPELIIVLTVATVGFLIYWFLAQGPMVDRLIRVPRSGSLLSHSALVQKIIGIFFIGLVPLVVAFYWLPGFPQAFGLGLMNWPSASRWLLGVLWIMLVLPFFSARLPDMQAYYPQVRAREWTPSLLTVNTIIWIAYLFCYEFLFRGFVLTTCMEVLGLWPAVTITTALSVTTHMPKGAKETFGTIPFSVMLCLAAAHTGSIWTGLILHVSLALANDYWALRYQRDMRVVWRS